MYTCIYIYRYVCIDVYITSIFPFIYLSIYLYMYVFICMYLKYFYAFVHILIYICMCLQRDAHMELKLRSSNASLKSASVLGLQLF